MPKKTYSFSVSDLINDKENGLSNKELCSKYEIAQSTLYRLLKKGKESSNESSIHSNKDVQVTEKDESSLEEDLIPSNKSEAKSQPESETESEDSLIDRLEQPNVSKNSSKSEQNNHDTIVEEEKGETPNHIFLNTIPYVEAEPVYNITPGPRVIETPIVSAKSEPQLSLEDIEFQEKKQLLSRIIVYVNLFDNKLDGVMRCDKETFISSLHSKSKSQLETILKNIKYHVSVINGINFDVIPFVKQLIELIEKSSTRFCDLTGITEMLFSDEEWVSSLKYIIAEHFEGVLSTLSDPKTRFLLSTVRHLITCYKINQVKKQTEVLNKKPINETLYDKFVSI
jgi:hypothetical protein